MINSAKPAFSKLSLDSHLSFNVRVDVGEYLANTWHYHPELELIWLKRSAGTRIIGNSVENFTHDDIVLIGKNMPHVFVHDKKYLVKNNHRSAEAVVIQFYETFLGEEFLKLPEVKDIQDLFVVARQGLCLTDRGKRKITPLMERILKASSLERILLLLEILRVMIDKSSYRVLADEGYIYQTRTEDEGRIKKIFDYTARNYHHNIRIEEIAEMVNLTKESFCRYFKSQTRKTYMDFLIEFRIGQACRMLVENKRTIKEIGYCCGYENLSNFYHQFKKTIKQSPLEYKKRYLNLTGAA